MTAALLLATPALARAAPPAALPEFARQCPTRHLGNMTAGDLEDLMEDFQSRLTPAQTRVAQDMVGYRCARVEAGLSCGNAATVDAYRRFHLLKAFVREACASGWTCRSFGDCVRTRP
jgi:hypothetical protein